MLDHIEVTLAGLAGTIQASAARRLGEERQAKLIPFRSSFAAQWQGKAAPDRLRRMG